MKRILIATDSFVPRWDGIARFLSEIIPHLSKSYEITVIAPRFKGSHPDPSGARIIRFPLVKRFSAADYTPARVRYSELRDEVRRADLVFTQTIGPIGALAVHEARVQKKPIIAYIHSIEWELFTYSISPRPGLRGLLFKGARMLARFVLNRCDLLLVPSREIGEYITFNGIKTQKKVLQMGTNVERFAPPADKQAIKKELGLSPTGMVIGYVGRLGREKDLPTLLRAFQRIQKQVPWAELLIVGDGVPEIKKLFEGKKGVYAVGRQDDVVKYYQAMDVYVLPSLTETSSLTTIEAMSCGVPVVCTPVGYVKTYVRPGHNGFLFPRRNSYVLAQHLKKLLTDNVLRAELAKNARRTALTDFSWDKKLAEMKQVFDLYVGDDN